MRHSILAAALLCALAAPAAAQPPVAPPLPAPSRADVPVARIDDLGKPMDLKANVWLPATKAAPTPLILYIHGKGGSYRVAGDRVARMVIGLTAKGFAVATIDYRLSGRMPAMLMVVTSPTVVAAESPICVP